MSSGNSQAQVLIVGCGCPLRSMGWYHAAQLVSNRCPSARLCYIVEPFYMSDVGKAAPGNEEFNAFRKEMETTHGVSFYGTVAEVPPPVDSDSRIVIISSRTADCPKLFSECISAGCKTILLEKPGAPSVAELEDMRDKAKDAGARVFMGFNKNVSNFCARTCAEAKKISGAEVTFWHNNAYAETVESLGECFERNSEGLLKNMSIHELAIISTFFDVTVENIDTVTVDKAFSKCQTLSALSGKEHTDFSKVKFKIVTKNGNVVSVAADRCGGNNTLGIVTAPDGSEVCRNEMPDAEAVAAIPALEEKYKGAMPYFLTQDPDYAVLKERVAKSTLDGTDAEGVATIDIAISSLKLAEYLTPLVQQELLS